MDIDPFSLQFYLVHSLLYVMNTVVCKSIFYDSLDLFTQVHIIIYLL